MRIHFVEWIDNYPFYLFVDSIDKYDILDIDKNYVELHWWLCYFINKYLQVCTKQLVTIHRLHIQRISLFSLFPNYNCFQILNMFDYFFTSVFTVEITLKVSCWWNTKISAYIVINVTNMTNCVYLNQFETNMQL